MTMSELYGKKVLGAISGLDRIRFRGTIRWLSNPRGLDNFLVHAGVLLKQFSTWAQARTQELRNSCAEQARDLQVPMIYLRSASTPKDELAQRLAEERGIREGSLCMFSVVEPCLSAVIQGDRSTRRLELSLRERKCVWIYHYFNDAELGFGHVRLQTWLPYTVNICLNGRHWLEQQLKAHGIGYVKDGNCFPWLQDVKRAQALLNEQLRSCWPQLLNRLTWTTCPALQSFLGTSTALDYYWSADESEWATDLMFESAGTLQTLIPRLLHHGMQVSNSPSVLRYFGKSCLKANGQLKGCLPAEILSDFRARYEGARIKHWLAHNSVKAYVKGSILRLETTINQTRDFKVFRSANDDERRPASWQKLRKGVSDLHRRCEVSQQTNQRYLQAFASADVHQTLHEIVRPTCAPCFLKGRRHRALNPWSEPDYGLLTFLARGELALNGFRNKDLRRFLFPDSHAHDPALARKQSAATTRRIRLLRAHRLIRKVPKVSRYVLTPTGLRFTTALISAANLQVKQLTERAA